MNRWLIARDRGHAVVHEFHHGGHPGHDIQTPDLHIGRLIAIGVTAVAFTVGVGVGAAQIAGRTDDQDKEHTGHFDRVFADDARQWTALKSDAEPPAIGLVVSLPGFRP
jgi:hypothetical protein